jgi:Xaa-Pro dipeptidase
MRIAGIDVLVVSSPDNIYYLTGYDSLGYYQFQAAVIERERSEPWLVIHEVEAGVAAASTWVVDLEIWQHAGLGRSTTTAPGDAIGTLVRRLTAAGYGTSRIGVEKSGYFLSISAFERMTQALPHAELVDTSLLVPQLRAIKSAREIEFTRAAAQLSDLGVKTAVESAAVGLRELDVLAAVNQAMILAGSEYPCLPPMLLSGPRTVAVHQSATAKIIADGEPVTVEIAGVVRRYNSNILRSFLPRGSQSNPDFAVAYEIVTEAVVRCTERAGPGVPGAEIDRLSREITKRFDRYRLHRTGYGLEAGYPPAWMGCISLSTADPVVLAPGMVLSIEPTLIFYDRQDEQRFSALVGNNVLITENGAESLNSVPFNLE